MEKALNPIKGSMEKLVFSYIVRNGKSSRKEVASALGVTQATVTYATTSLMKKGIIYEIGEKAKGKVGRKEIIIDVTEDYYYALGFDVTNISIYVSLLNLKTKIVENKRWDFQKLTQNVLDESFQYICHLLDKYSPKKVLGIGLLVQGYVENEKNYSLPIKNIKEQLESAVGPQIQIIMMNNTKGLALTELYFGIQENDFLLIKYGPGVGGAIVIDGKILDGFHNRAGEIGHIAWSDDNGEVCKICGKRGCLESQISFSHIAHKADHEFNGSANDIEVLYNACIKDNFSALHDAIIQLARAASQFIDTFDPKSILLAGEIFDNDKIFKFFLTTLTHYLHAIDPIKIQRITNFKDKRYKSAGILVLNNFFKIN